MRKAVVAGLVSMVIAITVCSVAWIYYRQSPDNSRHETTRWALIEDLHGDRLVVETASDEVWSQLVQLRQNGSRLWIGGIVERYDNSWGFRFKPKSLTVAEVTAEGSQATIRYISENLDQWLGRWAYVAAKVTETHFPT
jgi:ribosomal protein L18